MKIGLAATGGSLDAEVAEQFGRGRWFVVVDLPRSQVEC